MNKKIILIIIALAVAGAVYAVDRQYGYVSGMYSKYMMKSIVNTEVLTTDQQTDIIEAINRHMIFPKETELTMSRIADAKGLATKQDFFKEAIDGDLLITIVRTKQAVIYSPTRDRIVNVGPFYVDKSREQLADEARARAQQAAVASNAASGTAKVAPTKK
jgi:hypothetical protein